MGRNMDSCLAAAVCLIMIMIFAALAEDGDNADLRIGKQNTNLREIISNSNIVPYKVSENENNLKKEINYNLNNIINSKFGESGKLNIDADKEIKFLDNFDEIINQKEPENPDFDYYEIILDQSDIYQKQSEINTLFGEVIEEPCLNNEIEMQIPKLISFAV
jgi:hypothetical protein